MLKTRHSEANAVHTASLFALHLLIGVGSHKTERHSVAKDRIDASLLMRASCLASAHSKTGHRRGDNDRARRRVALDARLLLGVRALKNRASQQRQRPHRRDCTFSANDCTTQLHQLVAVSSEQLTDEHECLPVRAVHTLPCVLEKPLNKEPQQQQVERAATGPPDSTPAQ